MVPNAFNVRKVKFLDDLNRFSIQFGNLTFFKLVKDFLRSGNQLLISEKKNSFK